MSNQYIPKRIQDKNGRWTTVYVNPDDGSAVNTADLTKGTANSASSDFGEEKTSVFSPKFTDVLIDRYGDDPREVDQERAELYTDMSYAQAHYRVMRDIYSRQNAQGDVKDLEDFPEVKEARDKYNDKLKKFQEFEEENPVEWDQYYLVNGGHLHNSLGCHSLRNTTQLYVYPEASGMDTDEAIELGGSRVCTHCIPEAPVDIESRPTFVMTKDEREEQEARERYKAEQERKKAEKEAKAEERRKKAAEKAADPTKTLPEPVTIPGRISFMNNERKPVELQDIKKARTAARDFFVDAVADTPGLVKFDETDDGVRQQIHESNLQEFPTSMTKEERADVVKKFATTEKSWAANIAGGDVDNGVKIFTDMHNAVQALADNKNQPFEKMANSLFNHTAEKKMTDRINEKNKFLGSDQMLWKTGTVVDRRMKQMREFIDNPESFRDYLQ